jgi:hypothetical protein
LTGFPSPLGAERPQIITGGTNTPEWKQLPAPIRDKVDFVHLFLHYRASRPKTAEYVERRNDFRALRSLMLSMHTIASGGVTCDSDIALLKSGAAFGLEFYPGSFGREDDWGGWDKPHICPGRKQECIEKTKALRQLVADKFRKEL